MTTEWPCERDLTADDLVEWCGDGNVIGPVRLTPELAARANTGLVWHRWRRARGRGRSGVFRVRLAGCKPGASAPGANDVDSENEA